MHAHSRWLLLLCAILGTGYARSAVHKLNATTAVVTNNFAAQPPAAHLYKQYRSGAPPAPQKPSSALASHVIYQSPSVAENIYKELIVSSKPLNLRKYANNGGQKVKKTKKDSKIYYIPIPAMPYRYIPGIGYDYQPMKIKPIIPAPAPVKPQQQQQPQQYQQKRPQAMLKPQKANGKKPPAKSEQQAGSGQPATSAGESKVFHMKQQQGDYLFNGRPFRLQVAHAQAKHHLTPQNLKAKFYFNKKIIY